MDGTVFLRHTPTMEPPTRPNLPPPFTFEGMAATVTRNTIVVMLFVAVAVGWADGEVSVGVSVGGSAIGVVVGGVVAVVGVGVAVGTGAVVGVGSWVGVAVGAG